MYTGAIMFEARCCSSCLRRGVTGVGRADVCVRTYLNSGKCQGKFVIQCCRSKAFRCLSQVHVASRLEYLKMVSSLSIRVRLD